MAEPSETDRAKAREALTGCDGLPREIEDSVAEALAAAREEGERAYRAEIMAALGCHTAFVLQEIARLREVAAEAIGLEEVRQREQRARDEGERIGAAREREEWLRLLGAKIAIAAARRVRP